MLGAGLPIISLSIQTGVKLLLLYIFYTVLTINLSIAVSFLCTPSNTPSLKRFFCWQSQNGAEIGSNCHKFSPKMPFKKTCHFEDKHRVHKLRVRNSFVKTQLYIEFIA